MKKKLIITSLFTLLLTGLPSFAGPMCRCGYGIRFASPCCMQRTIIRPVYTPAPCYYGYEPAYQTVYYANTPCVERVYTPGFALNVRIPAMF